MNIRRLAGSTLAVLVGMLALGGTSALAAGPEAPEVSVLAPTPATTASVHGVLNPLKEGVAGSYEFLYKQGKAGCLGGAATPVPAGLMMGVEHEEVFETLSGLTQDTEYSVCLRVETAAHEIAFSPTVTFKTALPPETPETVSPAKSITATTAVFEGVLNPLKAGEAGTYQFFYRTSASECQGERTTNPVAAAGVEHELVSSKEEVTGLTPGTTYTFCVLASNTAGETAVGAPVTFTTPTVQPVSSEESVTEVTATSARLNAQVNPGGAETTYHFDYGTTTTYGNSTPESPPVGSDNNNHPAAAAIQGLQPATTYHYRIVATNPQSAPGGTPGPDQTFTTQTTGGETGLPDNRQYELVSPPQKDGAEVLGIGGGGNTPAAGGATQASESGASVTYLATAPIGANPPGNTLLTQMLSTRTPGRWSSQNIATPHKNASPSGFLNEGEEYVLFSSDLSRAVLVPHKGDPQPSLAPEVHQEVEIPEVLAHHEIYVRNDTTGVFRAVLTDEPLPEVELEGASPDLGDIVFGGPQGSDSPLGLDPEYPTSYGLYEWAAGHFRLVSVLPDGEPASGESELAASEGARAAGSAGRGARGVRHAISNDGTRVVWSSSGGRLGEGDLFTRDMATGETVEVDGAQTAGGSSGGGIFQAASSDGLRVFFTDTHELTGGAPEGGLFMFDVADGALTDLTPAGSGGQVQSFFGANDEGTSVYVVDSAVLTNVANGRGETATAGAGNVYLLRESAAGGGSWSATFVTDYAEIGNREGSNSLTSQSVRVSPDGQYLAFMSAQSVTKYDNRDANSGAPDEEVYLYNADSNNVVCASCDPTGARPVGQYDTEGFPRMGMDPFEKWRGAWLAATIPGWTPDGIDLVSGYQPRFLSDSGRLFFDSTDALVPHDVNGKEDVYQYEPVGVGGCQSPSYGQSASVVFSASSDGCVGLISAGTGAGDSSFFDASADGKDVFFTSEDGLVPQDVDGAFDIYDARVCSGAEPCAPSPPASPPACSTTDSCRTAPSPQPGVFGAPASATFEGAGNVPPGPLTGVKTKTRSETAARLRARNLARALKACRREPRKKRTSCEARARTKYGHAKTSDRRAK